MREIVRILCGSHLYGTNHKESNLNFKVIYVPSTENLLLQRGHLPLTPRQGIESKVRIRSLINKPEVPLEDILVDHIPAQKFVEKLCEGHTQAWDLIFAPGSAYIGSMEPDWYMIKNNAKSFLSRNMGTQYLISPRNWMERWKRGLSSGSKSVDGGHTWLPNSFYDGTQAYKDACHSVRIMGQFIELMETQHIVFPRGDRNFLKAIDRGKVSADKMQEHASAQLETASKVSDNSGLRHNPDKERAEEIIQSLHKGELCR